jgi:hypothetical protein
VFKVLGTIAIVAVIFFGFPIIAEEADSPCEAIAARAMAATRQPGSGGMELAMSRLLGGPMVRVAVAQRFPGWPTFVSCTGVYWRLRADPQGVEDEMRRSASDWPARQ